MSAAGEQTVSLPGERVTAGLIKQFASDVITLDKRRTALDTKIARLMGRHPLTPIITSLPGMGTLLAAELLVHTNNLTDHQSAGRLAAHAGLTPAAHDSGTVAGQHRRPQRFHRQLRRIFYLSALTAIGSCPRSRVYYDKKRDEGKNHHQALLALARRRVNVLWALIRDHTTYRATDQPARHDIDDCRDGDPVSSPRRAPGPAGAARARTPGAARTDGRRPTGAPPPPGTG
jgi:transposase